MDNLDLKKDIPFFDLISDDVMKSVVGGAGQFVGGTAQTAAWDRYCEEVLYLE